MRTLWVGVKAMLVGWHVEWRERQYDRALARYRKAADRAQRFLTEQRQDEVLSLTHTPGAHSVGDLFQWREGHPVYRITRIQRVANTALLDGGSAPCWEIRGVRQTAKEGEVADDLNDR